MSNNYSEKNQNSFNKKRKFSQKTKEELCQNCKQCKKQRNIKMIDYVCQLADLIKLRKQYQENLSGGSTKEGQIKCQSQSSKLLYLTREIFSFQILSYLSSRNEIFQIQIQKHLYQLLLHQKYVDYQSKNNYIILSSLSMIKYNEVVFPLPGISQNSTVNDVKEALGKQLKLTSKQVDNLNLQFLNKPLHHKFKKLAEYGYMESSFIEMTVGTARGFQFADLQKKIQLKTSYTSDHTSPFIIKPGFIFRGICTGANCIGSGKLICINMGMGTHNIGKIKHKQVCPKCKSKTQKITTFGYYKCKINVEGVKQEDQSEFNKQFTANNQNYHTFESEDKDLVRWSHIEVTASPL